MELRFFSTRVWQQTIKWVFTNGCNSGVYVQIGFKYFFSDIFEKIAPRLLKYPVFIWKKTSDAYEIFQIAQKKIPELNKLPRWQILVARTEVKITPINIKSNVECQSWLPNKQLFQPSPPS